MLNFIFKNIIVHMLTELKKTERKIIREHSPAIKEKNSWFLSFQMRRNQLF